MTTVFRLTGADFSGRGLPNIFPFVAKSDMAYGFDFRSRATRLVDLVGKRTLTPYRVDQAGGQVNVIDPAILTDASGGLGVNVVMGHLRSNLPVAPIPTGGAEQFTTMVVGGYSGLAFDAAKVVASAPVLAVLAEYGKNISGTGWHLAVDPASGTVVMSVESSGTSLSLGSPGGITAKRVIFLTFDGTNWRLIDKTNSTSATGTNTSLAVGANPIAVNTTSSGGMMGLGGHFRPDTTLYGATPTLYQQARWGRVLTDVEIEDQYQKTKLGFSSVPL